MKNIHVIPTDKLSRLIIYSTLLNEFRLLDEPIDDWKHKRHIYITSTELTLAKKGDWYLGSPCYTELIRCHCDSFPNEKSKVLLNKIILTTDQDLIKDGVQAIDDEFLEWFVKNPSCENVDISKHYDKVDIDGKVYYKIIIPQEEPKSHIEYTNTDDCTSMIYNQQEEQLPTKWFKTEQISTWIGKSITRITTEGESIDENEGGHGKLIVMHQCGENKEELISQLETMIYGLKEGFENFAN